MTDVVTAGAVVAALALAAAVPATPPAMSRVMPGEARLM